jgi:hypothetical protein
MDHIDELLNKSDAALTRGAVILDVFRKQVAAREMNPESSMAILAQAQATVDLGAGLAALAMARIQRG